MTGLPLNVDWQQILLHLFNFTILFGALYILLYKPVKDFMDGREAHYAEMDSMAEQALADAESSKETYESKLKSFDAEIKAERTKAGEEIDAEKKRRLESAKAEADRIISDAKVEADKERGKIIASAQKDITKLISEAMEKLAIGESDKDVFDKFLDAAEGEDK